MLELKDSGFIGHDSFFDYFYGADSLEKYQKSLKTQPLDWYYRNKLDITYVRNSNGHRNNIEISDLKGDYILFTGCSFTEGIGLQLEHTFSYVLAKKLNLPYYNLGLGGSGWGVIKHNLNVWFDQVKILPKYLIILWPTLHRFHYKMENSKKIIQILIETANSEQKDILISKEFYNQQLGILEGINSFLLNKSINFYQYYWGSHSDIMEGKFSMTKFYITVDRARDIHPGIETNKNWADIMFNDINHNP